MKINVRIAVLLFIFIFLAHLALARLPKEEKRLINAKIDIVWENVLKLFPKKEIKIKKIDRHRYLIIAQKRITHQKRFSRDIKIRLIPRGEQTLVTFNIETFIASIGLGRTKKIIEDFLNEVKIASERSRPALRKRPIVARGHYKPPLKEAVKKRAGEIRIASYNICHMDEIIDKSLTIKMKERCNAIARNIRAIDPDILAIQEAPSTREQLEFFVKGFLDDKYNVYFQGSGDRSLALLIKKGISPPCKVKKVERPEYKSQWQDDIDKDGEYEHRPYSFSSPPLELDLKFNLGTLKIIVLHLTSKYGRTPQERMLARYRLIAEAKRFREIIKAEVDKDIIILGDMNDSPGLDLYERELGIDGISQLIGRPPSDLKSSLIDIPRKWRFTCVYLSNETDDPDVAWIDRILFTKALEQKPIIYKRGSGKIYYELMNPLASDHIPVSAIFVLR